MSDSNDRDAKTRDPALKDRETAALIAAQAFIIFSGIYWLAQIDSVRNLLQLSYG
jgi:hypothetical protein